MKRRILFIGFCLILLAWPGVLLLSAPVSHYLVSHFGNIIGKLGAAKIPDAELFIRGRLKDVLCLTSLAWVALFTIEILPTLFSKFSRATASILSGIFLFIVVNVLALVAAQTSLFWLILRGPSVENQAQFRGKENMLSDIKMHPVIALVGNSQSRAQIEEEEFNEKVNGKAWMMELHFPGSRIEDVFLTANRLGPEKIDGFVYYATPVGLYGDFDSSIARDLLRLRDLPLTLEIGAWHRFLPTTACYTALGMAIPLFQDRSAMQHAIFGGSGIALAVASKTVEQPNVVQTEKALSWKGDAVDFQKDCFLRFLKHCAANGQFVIVIGGQMNPTIEVEFPKEMRPDFEAFLKQSAAENPNMTLVWQNELLVQPPESYLDGSHVTEATQKSFSDAFSEWYLRNGYHPADKKAM